MIATTTGTARNLTMSSPSAKPEYGAKRSSLENSHWPAMM
ncbi:Uncharacterised protein [Bordetella pertussis]|nr:Uncharacterised protein [Bordetella pertussis]